MIDFTPCNHQGTEIGKMKASVFGMMDECDGIAFPILFSLHMTPGCCGIFSNDFLVC